MKKKIFQGKKKEKLLIFLSFTLGRNRGCHPHRGHSCSRSHSCCSCCSCWSEWGSCGFNVCWCALHVCHSGTSYPNENLAAWPACCCVWCPSKVRGGCPPCMVPPAILFWRVELCLIITFSFVVASLTTRLLRDHLPLSSPWWPQLSLACLRGEWLEMAGFFLPLPLVSRCWSRLLLLTWLT